MKKINKVDRKLKHLMLSSELEESGTSILILTTILITSITLILLVIWAATSDMQAITSAEGVILPTTQIQKIQHLEGGIVQQIHLQNGAPVEKNKIIMNLYKDQFVSDLEQYIGRRTALKIDIARLNLFVQNKNVSHDDFLNLLIKQKIPYNENTENLISRNLLLLQQQHSSLAKEKHILQKQIYTLEEDIKNYNLQLQNFKSRADILEEQYNIYEKLGETKTVSKLKLLDSADRLKETQGTMLELRRSKVAATNKVIETKEQLLIVENEAKTQALEELTDLTAQLQETEQLINKATDKVARLTVKAPVAGILQKINAEPGSVVSPGEILFEIVPHSEHFIIEAKINVTERAHIKLSDHVKVKVSAYDFASYGTLDGSISHISASTLQDNIDEDPYYKSIILLKKNYVGDDPNANKLLPGMTVTVDIITNRQTILNYLLKPIQQSVSSAFHER